MDRRGARVLSASSFDVIEALTSAGDVRGALLDAIGARHERDLDVDARLVSDLLRSNGRVTQTLQTRRALVELCGLLRAVDAAIRGDIELHELQQGLEIHAARTERFADFHAARPLLRTITELLEGAAGVPERTRLTLAQLQLVHGDLLRWLVDELTADPGDGAGARHRVDHARPDPRSAWRINEPSARRRAHDAVEELLHGADHHPVTGLVGAAWTRGWAAVPVQGDRLGELPGELPRIVHALRTLDVEHVVQVSRSRSAPWRIDAGRVVVGDGLRDSWRLPADAAGLAAAAAERVGPAVLTTVELAFAYVERDGYHLVLGPASFVQQVLDRSPTEAIADFREHVERQVDEDGDPPPDLLEIATRCGRLRRRMR